MSSPAGDPYLDPASGVLRNLLGITDAAELARAEAALSASRLIDLERRRLPGRYDPAHLQAFHRYILGDVYDWAASCAPCRSRRDRCSACRSTWSPTRRTCSAGWPQHVPRQGHRVAGIADRRRCLAAGEQPDAAAAACRGALRGRFPLCGTRALTTMLAGVSPEAGAVAGPVRFLLIRSCGLAGWGVCVAGPRCRPAARWPSGCWMDGARGMGLPWRCRSGPAPPPSLSGAGLWR